MKRLALAHGHEIVADVCCPVCGRPVERTDRGVIRAEFTEKWCHRNPQGEPCAGYIGMTKIEA